MTSKQQNVIMFLKDNKGATIDQIAVTYPTLMKMAPRDEQGVYTGLVKVVANYKHDPSSAGKGRGRPKAGYGLTKKGNDIARNIARREARAAAKEMVAA